MLQKRFCQVDRKRINGNKETDSEVKFEDIASLLQKEHSTIAWNLTDQNSVFNYFIIAMMLNIQINTQML